MLQQDVWKRLSTLLLGLFIGVAIGAIRGQWQFEKAWEQVQNDPRSFRGDAGSYLCLMGDAPIYEGLIGGMFGGVAGLCGGFCWLKLRKESSVA
jgi:hypothetical protein